MTVAKKLLNQIYGRIGGMKMTEFRIVWLGPGSEEHPEAGTWPTLEKANDMAQRSVREQIAWSTRYKIVEVKSE